MTAGVERRIAEHFPSPFLRSYSRSKLRTDPVYRAVLECLRGIDTPLYDIGCGIGLLEFFLREQGWDAPVTGVDHDAAKIATANAVGQAYSALTFRTGDARDAIEPGVSVTALDVLHYFTADEQQRVLANIANAVGPGGVAIIRDAISDGSIRYRITALQEHFARAIRWLKAERLHFPAREEVERPFRARGFEVEVRPLWGATPFNNYLFVFRRPISGTTNL